MMKITRDGAQGIRSADTHQRFREESADLTEGVVRVRLNAVGPRKFVYRRGLLYRKDVSDAAYKGKDAVLGNRIEACAAHVAELAERHSVSREGIVIAWVLRHPAGILPVLGTTSPERITACAESLTIDLSREEWNDLYCLGRGENLP
jgi:hypothetical protein